MQAFELLKEKMSELRQTTLETTLENYVRLIKFSKGTHDRWEKMLVMGMFLALYTQVIYVVCKVAAHMSLI